MTPKSFQDDMKRGLGRCYIELKNSSDIEKYRKSMLWGCLHRISFDPQCEGTRAAYLYRLVSLFPDQAYFLEKISEKYRSVSGRDLWFFQQLTELLSCFADSGYQAAKDALSEKYDALYSCLLKKKSFRGYDFQRDNFELLTTVLLGGYGDVFPEKLIFDYGNLFLKSRHHHLEWSFDSFADSLEESVGKGKLIRELKSHKDIPEWKSFYDGYLKWAAGKKKPANNIMTDVLSAEELIKEADSGKKVPMYQMLAFSRTADDAEKKKLADFIEKADSPEKKAELLKAFWHENYPGDHRKLIEYASSDCEALSAAAEETLGNCQSEAVYRYAKERLLNNRRDPAAISILLANYHPSDKEQLISVLSEMRIDDESDSGWHWIVLQILNAYHLGVRLPREFFVFVYEKSLCSCCRSDAVRYMGKRRWLSPEMIDECQYDSNSDIVSYIGKKRVHPAGYCG